MEEKMEGGRAGWLKRRTEGLMEVQTERQKEERSE